jgi:UDP-glucose 4-epimerase
MKRKVLVTGGAGFIGSHLCEKLLGTGNYEVYSLDNYFTGSKKNHIAGVTYLRGSTADILDIVDIIPDYIYHLGEYSRVEQSFSDIEKVWRFNKDVFFLYCSFVEKQVQS